MKHIQTINFILSYGCLVHCTLLPLLIIIFPFLGHEFVELQHIETVLIPIIFLLNLNLSWQIVKKHHTKIHFLFMLAWIPVIILFFLPSSFGEEAHTLYHFISIIPVSALSVYHIYLSRKCRVCSKGSESAEVNQT